MAAGEAKESASLLTREAIFAREDLITQRVEVPEWGGAVLVKVLKADEKMAYERSNTIRRRDRSGVIQIDPNDKVNFRVNLVIRACVDATGAPLFSEVDVLALGGKSAAALERIFEAACALNRIGRGDIEEMEEQEKNS
jgi:hypothetical protein